MRFKPVVASVPDAGAFDAGPVDAGAPDAGTFDGGERRRLGLWRRRWSRPRGGVGLARGRVPPPDLEWQRLERRLLHGAAHGRRSGRGAHLAKLCVWMRRVDGNGAAIAGTDVQVTCGVNDAFPMTRAAGSVTAGGFLEGLTAERRLLPIP